MVCGDCPDRRVYHPRTRIPAGRRKAPAVACHGKVNRRSAATISNASVAASGKEARIMPPLSPERGTLPPPPAVQSGASAGTVA
jgi:hypothetical protein